jgi:outer membrane protein assembly factor BamB
MSKATAKGRAQPAEIVREYGPFPGASAAHGVTFDGNLVWYATGEKLQSFAPESGEPQRALDVACEAGTTFDGEYFYQLAGARILKLEPMTGKVVATLPAPSAEGNTGLTWAEGCLWVGHFRDRKIHQIDANTGALLRTIESDRFVTGVTWVDGELWHGTWEDEESELRQVDAESGAVLVRLELPRGMGVSGLESDGKELFYCGGGKSGKVRAVHRPRRQSGTK